MLFALFPLAFSVYVPIPPRTYTRLGQNFYPEASEKSPLETEQYFKQQAPKRKKMSLVKTRIGFKDKVLLKKCYVQITKLTKDCPIKSIFFIFAFENIFKVY